jgi:alanine-glyoxylate transaminase/serine-glyoxylate transaminase/serine-pyruvate transaminase
MGFASNERNVLSCLSALEAVLDGAGASITRGTALPAAQVVLSER